MSKPKKIAVTERNLQKSADRVDLPSPLVSVEVEFLRNALGNTATATEMDERVRVVRQTPWSEIMRAL
jgi:hypothetical protein